MLWRMPIEPIPSPLSPPPLRRVGAALPPYRYVPGLNPHPFRHRGGHMYVDGRPPAEDAAAVWEHWVRGLDLYDHRFYWEAHESWEACWHRTPPGNARELEQALIQSAAAILKRHLGHDRAAERLRKRAAARFTAILDAGERELLGVDVAACWGQLERWFRGEGDWPVIVEASTGTPRGYKFLFSGGGHEPQR
ncbi:MAG: DUF309 domain-containing protein [Myxococcota bacterium]